MAKVYNSPHEPDSACSMMLHFEVDVFELLCCQSANWTAAIKVAL
jgi:hypothetical protein